MSDVRTFGDMVTRISREIRREGMTADIKDAIVTSIDHYKEERFWFNEGESTAQTSSGVHVYTRPDNFIEMDELWLEDSAGVKYDLTENSWEDLAQMQTQTNAFPTDYAEYRDRLHLRPVPDRTLTLRASGLKELPEVSASASSGTTNSWMTDAEKMIRCKAKAEVFLHRLRNSEQTSVMEASADQAKRKLKDRTVKSAGSGTIKKTTF